MRNLTPDFISYWDKWENRFDPLEGLNLEYFQFTKQYGGFAEATGFFPAEKRFVVKLTSASYNHYTKCQRLAQNWKFNEKSKLEGESFRIDYLVA